MNKFFERYKLQKLTHKKMRVLKKHCTIKENEFVVKNFTTRELQVQMASLVILVNISRRNNVNPTLTPSKNIKWENISLLIL